MLEIRVVGGDHKVYLFVACDLETRAFFRAASFRTRALIQRCFKLGLPRGHLHTRGAPTIKQSNWLLLQLLILRALMLLNLSLHETQLTITFDKIPVLLTTAQYA